VGSGAIMQIGWATSDCCFDPYLGQGVGGCFILILDDAESAAYDGYRVRKWHKLQFKSNQYGIKWEAGDIVTALFDLDAQQMVFLLNGVDLGVAFKHLDNNRTWCPAVSLTSYEWGRFIFGTSKDPLKYCPDDYTPIGTSLNNIHSPSLKWTPEIDNFFVSEDPYLIDPGSNIVPNTESIIISSTTFSSEVENIVSSGKNVTGGDSSCIKTNNLTSNTSPTISNISDATVVMDKDVLLSFYYELYIDLVDLPSSM
jgi:hypothetical protein